LKKISIYKKSLQDSDMRTDDLKEMFNDKPEPEGWELPPFKLSNRRRVDMISKLLKSFDEEHPTI
jgi:hypothetical protein